MNRYSMNYKNENLLRNNTETLKYIRNIMTYNKNQNKYSFLIQLGENLIKIKEILTDNSYKNYNISKIIDIDYKLNKTNIMTFIQTVNNLLDYLINDLNSTITHTNKDIKYLIYALADKGIIIKSIGQIGQIEEPDNDDSDDDDDDDDDNVDDDDNDDDDDSDDDVQNGGKKSTKKSSTKKAPVKKAPVKKAPVKKAPVKKAPVKKAPVKKAPVKKAPVKNPKSKK